MIIEREVIVNQNINEAWKVLGTDFANADKWASAIKHSEGKGAGFNGASCSERGCETSMGGLKEKITTYSDKDYSLSYNVYEGMPSMVKKAANNWSLTPHGQNKAKLNMRMEMEIGGFMGTLMKPMMKMKLGKMGNELVEEFKYYVENGKPHPRKVKAMKK